MTTRQRLLLLGGGITAAASLLHVGIILGGGAWYRFFGAGERMARFADRGDLYPAIVTSFIAAVLAAWSLYALSGAGVIRRLPLLRPALMAISAVYLTRGVLGIPLVYLVDHPYALELRNRMTFMLVSSLISVLLGACYAAGAVEAGRRDVADASA